MAARPIVSWIAWGGGSSLDSGRGELGLSYLLPRALYTGGAARGEGSSRESAAPFLVVAAAAAQGSTWTLRRTTFGRGQARSSYSSRSRVWSAWGNGCWRVRFNLRRALAGKPSALLGGAREQRDSGRRGTGGVGRPARRWAGALEMAGKWPGRRGPGDQKPPSPKPDVATEALQRLHQTWKGRVGPRKGVGKRSRLGGRGRGGGIVPLMS